MLPSPNVLLQVSVAYCRRVRSDAPYLERLREALGVPRAPGAVLGWADARDAVMHTRVWEGEHPLATLEVADGRRITWLGMTSGAIVVHTVMLDAQGGDTSQVLLYDCELAGETGPLVLPSMASPRRLVVPWAVHHAVLCRKDDLLVLGHPFR